MTEKDLVTRSINQIIPEYDRVIQQLKHQITNYKEESERLIKQVKLVTDENSRLSSELRNVLESQVKGQNGTAEMNLDRLTEIHTCKSDLVMSKRALDVANMSTGHYQSKCDQLERERQKCLLTAQKLDREVTGLQEQLSQSNVKLKAANIRNEDMKVSLEQLKQELKKKTSRLDSISNQEITIDHRLHSLKTTNAELDAKLSAVQKELSILRESKPDMEAQITVLQEKVILLKKREEAAIEHVRESVEMTEAALAEKQKTEFREQQWLHENKKLKKTISVILEEAGARTKAEIERLKSEYNQNIDKMADEIQLLEKDCNEKQSKLDRAERDKKEIEQELKKTLSQGPQEQTWVKNTLSDLRSKLFTAERARDEMNSKIKSLELGTRTDHARLSEEKRLNEEVLEQLGAERKRNQIEVTDLRKEIASLTEQFKASQEMNNTAERNLTNLQRKHKKQVSILNEQNRLKENDLVSKAKCAQEAHNKIAIDLRELVTAQQSMAIRWREETAVITSKFERTVTELHGRLDTEKKRNQQITEKYNRHKLANEKLAKKVDKLQQEIFQTSQDLKDAESKAEHTSNQLNILLLREKKMMKEKRDAQRQLDHAKLQIARNLSIMDPTSTKTVHFSHGGAHSINNSSLLFPTRQTVFDEFNKELHSTPKLPPGYTHTNDLPINFAGQDINTRASSPSNSTLLSQ